MSDNTPIIESVPEDQLKQGAIPDDDLHEQLWAEIDARIATATSASYVRLARVVEVAGGLVRVQFFSATQAHGVGFAHTMGYQYRVDQRVAVAPTEGGDFVVIGALTSAQGDHERVVTNADMASGAVDKRVVANQSLDWTNMVEKGIRLDRLEQTIQDAVAKAITSVQAGHIKGGSLPNPNGNDLIVTQKTAIEPGDVKGGKPGDNADKKIVTQDWVEGRGYYKEGGNQNAKVVTQGDLSAYVKRSDLAKNAIGSEPLATEKYVDKKVKSSGGGGGGKKGDGG